MQELGAGRQADGVDPWHQLAQWLLGDRFRNVVFEKFGSGIKQRFGGGVQIQVEKEAGA